MNKPLNKWEVLINNKKVCLKIGVQLFTIDYDTDSEDELNWMKKMLETAMSSVAPDRKKTTSDFDKQAIFDKLVASGIISDFTEVNGNEYEQVMPMLDSMEPVSTSNNQRTITEEYKLESDLYHVTYGLFDHPYLEKKNKR